MRKLLMGNEAFAHAALEAGVNVVAGYPGTPSTELVETVAALHAKGAAQGVHVEWSTNEKVAMELVAGASYCGARTLFTCKQVGLNVASDPLMSLNYVGVNGAVVLFVADDPGPISSQTEQDTRRFAMFAKVPVFDPISPEQGFAMMQAAFDLSEKYHTPVIVRPTTRVNHASAFMEVQGETTARPIPQDGFQKDPKWVIFPKRSWEAHGEIIDRLGAIARECSTNPVLAAFNPMHEGPDEDAYLPRVGIMAGGISAAYAQEALNLLIERAAEKGDVLPNYRFMQVGTPYPFPADAVARFVEGLDEVLVLEELDHVLEDQLLAFCSATQGQYLVRGKLTGDARERGENTVDDCVARIARFLGLEAGEYAPILAHFYGAETMLPQRPPVLCAGCPHRGSFFAIKKALGKTPAVLCGDIGCYTLGNAAPLEAVDTCLCMGASIAMAQGFSVADARSGNSGRKHIAFVGDSTFFASSITGLANAVYNEHDITLVVLDNSTTAMTGSQPHPGTGATLMGSEHEGISIAKVLKALNFGYVTTANPLDAKKATAAAKRAIEYAGPSAVIFESPCVKLAAPQAPMMVDAQACTGCRKCINSIGCPAIAFDAHLTGEGHKRGQAYVDASLCNGCGLCTQQCPFGALAKDVEHPVVPLGAKELSRRLKEEIYASISTPEGLKEVFGDDLVILDYEEAVAEAAELAAGGEDLAAPAAGEVAAGGEDLAAGEAPAAGEAAAAPTAGEAPADTQPPTGQEGGLDD